MKLRLKIYIVFLYGYLVFINTTFAQPFTGCATGNEVVSSSQPTLEQQLFDKVDQVRQDTFGLPPLVQSCQLDYAARYHTADMKADAYWCHSTYDIGGSDVCYGISNLNYQCDRITRIQLFAGAGVSTEETLALGGGTATSIVNMWLGEPSHRNILASSFTHGGVCVATNSGNVLGVGGNFWTLNLANVIMDTTNQSASICDGDSILLRGAYQKTAGTYNDTLSGINGCDSIIVVTTLTVDELPSTSVAGTDQTVCSSTATLAGNTPTVGSGEWTVISGTATITTPSSPASGVTGLVVGSATLRWTISNGSCTPSTDDVVITRNASNTYTWEGDVSTNWNNAGNWDSGVVPDICDVIIVPGGTPFQPTISVAGAKCKNITINQSSGGKVTISGAGTLTVND